MKTLYKKDSKDKIRVWKIYTQGSTLLQESGLLGGKMLTNSKVCTPKNVGKSNSTTGEEQVLLEMESEYKSKLDEGYFLTEEEAKNNEVILPMLAKDYSLNKHKIDWSDCYIQPKLDGMRCLAHINNGEVELISRDGKIINNMQHIINELSTIKENIILDGELYAHGLSFQENMKLIKKYRKGETENIKYHIYDIVSSDSFILRNKKIQSFNFDKYNYLYEVFTLCLNDEDELPVAHTTNIANGYEGSILRWGNEGYKLNSRSSSLLKYKDFQDIACTIIDVIPATQRPTWGVPVLKHKDITFEAGTRLSHSDREDLLTNKETYIGSTAEIRFFEWTDEGKPRFPVMVGIRLDK